jgi:putative ABC transport system ATP-binding protein
MCLLAQSIHRLPLVGRYFRPAPTAPVSESAPAVLCRREPVLAGSDLVRSFGEGETRSVALKGVSVDFHPGELNLLMGPSGSGKSTLLAVLSGLLRPDNGVVGALGQDVWRMSETEMERFRLRHCSYIFQGYNLFPALTAREQLEIVLKWGEGCPSREARQRADHVLGQLGLSGKSHLRPAELSGGEKQRVAIGRALVKNPTLVFADEPTSALDWENGQQVIRLLTETARERGAMVLVVTHDPRLTPFADRVFELADGQLQAEAKPQQEAVHEVETTAVAIGGSGSLRGYDHAALSSNSARLRLYDPAHHESQNVQ